MCTLIYPGVGVENSVVCSMRSVYQKVKAMLRFIARLHLKDIVLCPLWLWDFAIL